MFLAAAFLPFQTPAPYTVQTIFTHDQMGAQCVMVNDNSQVLCGIDPIGKPQPYVGFVWENGQFTQIPAPASDDPNDVASVQPSAMNNNGQVVGMICGGTDWAHRYTYFFEWSKGSGMRRLTANKNAFMPFDINNNGDVVGFSWDDDNNETAGLLKGSEYTALYGTKNDEEPAYIVTDNGVVGGQQNDMSSNSSWSIFIPPGSHDLMKLSLPPYVPNPDPEKNPVAVLADINNGGWMIGDVNTRATNNWLTNHIGAVWSPNNTFYSLGAGFMPRALNDKGIVVGAQMELMMGHFPHSAHAFIYDSTHGIRFLDSMVPYGTPALTNAVSINNMGEILCQGPECDWYLLKPAE